MYIFIFSVFNIYISLFNILKIKKKKLFDNCKKKNKKIIIIFVKFMIFVFKIKKNIFLFNFLNPIV